MPEVAYTSFCSTILVGGRVCTNRAYVNIVYFTTIIANGQKRPYCKKCFDKLLRLGYYTRAPGLITHYIPSRDQGELGVKVTVIYDYYLFPFNDPIKLQEHNE